MAVPAVGSSRKVEEQRLAEQSQGHLDEEQAPAPPPAAEQPRPFAARSFGSHRGRAAHTARRPDRKAGEHALDRDYTGGHEQGVPDFPDPLPGYHHYADKDAVLRHQPLDVGPAEPYYSKGMAHGVPLEEIPHGGRPTPRPEDRHLIEASRLLIAEETKPSIDPVPVYMVERGTGPRPLRRAALRQVTIEVAGSDPQVLVPRNPHRSSVRLLNESGSPVRILFDLALSGGALLPANMHSYLEVDTEDEICAYVPPASAAGAAGYNAYGNVTNPAANAVLATTGPVPAGTYSVLVQINMHGTTPAATDINNTQLEVGGNVITTLLNGGSAGAINTDGPFTVQASAGQAITVNAIALVSDGAQYSVQLTATPLAPDNFGGTGPALVSVIEQYDVAGGT